jgi:hypothetical protein
LILLVASILTPAIANQNESIRFKNLGHLCADTILVQRTRRHTRNNRAERPLPALNTNHVRPFAVPRRSGWNNTRVFVRTRGRTADVEKCKQARLRLYKNDAFNSELADARIWRRVSLCLLSPVAAGR